MKKSELLAAASLAVLSTMGSAIAQQAPQAEPSTGIETVTVTAEKRSEDAQTVPISMNIFQTKDLDQFHTSDFRELQTSVPGMFIQTSPTNDGVYIRGFGSSPANPAADQDVSLYQDGIYGGRARQFMSPFFDVERVEVLRGPQGALLGKNTAAGAINIVTAGPTDTFEASTTVSYDIEPSGVEASGYVSGPLADGLSARLAAKFTDTNGFLRNSATNQNVPSPEEAFVRGTLKYDGIPNLDVTTKIEYENTSTDGNSIEYVSQLVQQPLYSVKDVPPPFGTREFDHQHGYNSATTANLALGDYTITSITGFSGFASGTNSGGAALDPENFTVNWDEGFNQQSEELRLLSPTDQAVEFIVGVYADHSDDRIKQTLRFDIFGGFADGQQHSNYAQSAYSLSAFADATWHVTDDLRLVGSVRYTRIGKRGAYDLFADFGPPILGLPTSQSGSFHEDHVDPSGTIQYDIRPGIMAYAAIARGSKAGGFDPSNTHVNAGDFHFEPERSTNYEVGIKSAFLDNTVVFNVTAYILKFQDLQVSAYVPAQASLVTTNAASATSKGFETTLAWQVTDGLQLSGSGSYIYAAYDNYPGAACIAGQPVTCTPATNNLKGVLLPFTPRWSGQLTADFRKPLTDDLALELVGAVSYRSSIWVDTSYHPVYGLQPATAKLDLRAQLGAPDDTWSVAILGRNLTNVLTRGQSYQWPLESGPGGEPVAGVNVISGRIIALEGSLKF